MKVYVTKYALTQGIEEVSVTPCFDIDPNMVHDDRPGYMQCFHKGEWHRTLEEAVAKASAMRLKRIASLLRQVDKLTALKF